ncbi:hypothetical protein NLU13_7373 [Sarocladium strictum]|uniref:Sin3-associated polypeptide Sap18 n=1 Tax=Sarocladium strictum TaxID=5046 RepID=A0AA39GE63_SARSR|nr:hypothetical protein NLU13_7373 [Sarocladium strictum]
MMTTELEDEGSPFLVRVFCRVGAFHRPEEFISGSLPPHVSLHTWPSCTLKQLALELTELSPPGLPSPAYGTRLVFQLVFPDLRRINAAPTGQFHYGVKDLGSVIIGARPAKEDEEVMWEKTDEDRTLGDSRLVVGDFISCAVLPPLDDGSVAPISAARTEPNRSMSSGRPPHRINAHESRNHFAGHSEQGWGGRGADRGGAMGSGAFPSGEWRRGEQLPAGRPRGGRSRGRW